MPHRRQSGAGGAGSRAGLAAERGLEQPAARPPRPARSPARSSMRPYSSVGSPGSAASLFWKGVASTNCPVIAPACGRAGGQGGRAKATTEDEWCSLAGWEQGRNSGEAPSLPSSPACMLVLVLPSRSARPFSPCTRRPRAPAHQPSSQPREPQQHQGSSGSCHMGGCSGVAGQGLKGRRKLRLQRPPTNQQPAK